MASDAPHPAFRRTDSPTLDSVMLASSIFNMMIVILIGF